MKRRPHFHGLTAITLIAGFALSACGIRGGLKTPPPVWGADTRTAAQKEEVTETERIESDDILIEAPELIEPDPVEADPNG
ncbi:hypothetical protein N9W89_03395 [Hellea sp.]|nr:hypothetical protein [Hellea sp.]